MKVFKGMASLNDVYTQVDTNLKDKQYAMGASYSIVDPYLLVFFRWGNRLGLDMQKYANWAKHTQLLEQRNAVKMVLGVENISIWK